MAPLATLGGIYRLSHCFTYMGGNKWLQWPPWVVLIACHIVLLIWGEQMAPLATLGGIYRLFIALLIWGEQVAPLATLGCIDRLSHCFTYMGGTNGSISHLGWYR